MGDFHLLFFASFLVLSETGQSLQKRDVRAMSALTLIATEEQISGDGRQQVIKPQPAKPINPSTPRPYPTLIRR
jgi:hypothetical protein